MDTIIKRMMKPIFKKASKANSTPGGTIDFYIKVEASKKTKFSDYGRVN
jgi:hypothetical protein